ncbi:MAG: thioredoxin [Chloroflexi bacterium]|nr:thioredoxin [Chloroflexota bacterium]
MTTGAVLEATDANFTDVVVQRSHQMPVIVDFWAAWCEPCHMLSPILEQIASEYAGRVQLVKVNIDQNPMVTQQYGIQSIPAVKAFEGGGVTSEFAGAQPEDQVRAFFDILVPSQTDHAMTAAQRFRALGDDAAAREQLELVLADDPNQVDAALELADILSASGDPADTARARELAGPFEHNPRARRAIGRIGLAELAAGKDRTALEARVTADDSDAEARYHLGAVLAVGGEWEAALEHLLATVRLDRELDEDGGRLRMLDAFAVLGDTHELAVRYRGRLMNVIF